MGEIKSRIAICYDFDHTLTPIDMQEQGFLEKCCNYKREDFIKFWEDVKRIRESENMDQTTAYMYHMVTTARKNHQYITKNLLKDLGKEISFFPGVEEWFECINKIGADFDCEVEHYIISNGNLEIIEGSSISSKITKIYASTFHYDESGNADWPSMVVNYTNKTQFLFRIKKQKLEISDDSVNDFIAENDIPIPFHNMIYIGDSDTDVPCMKIIKSNGGVSICVYEKDKIYQEKKAHKMFEDNRVNYYCEADYSKCKSLYNLVVEIIKNISSNEKLKKFHNAQKDELYNLKKKEDNKDKDLWNDVNALTLSSSFATTHNCINKLKNEIDELNPEHIKSLVDAGKNNCQIYWISSDDDVKNFYSALKNKCRGKSDLFYYEKEIDSMFED